MINDPDSRSRLNLVSDSIEFFEHLIELNEASLKYDLSGYIIDEKVLERIEQLERQVNREKKIGQSIIEGKDG